MKRVTKGILQKVFSDASVPGKSASVPGKSASVPGKSASVPGKSASVPEEIINRLAKKNNEDILRFVHEFRELRRGINLYPEEYSRFTLAESLVRGDLSPKRLLREEKYLECNSPHIREKTRGIFFRILLKRSGMSEKEAKESAKAIESSCYNSVVTQCKISEKPIQRNWGSRVFIGFYTTRCGAVAMNLDPDSSVCSRHGPYAMDKMESGDFAPEDFGGLSERELCPEASKKEVEEINVRLQQKIVEKISKMYKCPMCGARSSKYKEIQIGAGDEPATIFCICMECGTNFRGH